MLTEQEIKILVKLKKNIMAKKFTFMFLPES